MSDKTISQSDIEAAEKLLGIEYSQDERELMVDNLEDLIASAQARRKVIFPNALPPATTFDPRLPTTVMPVGQKPILTSNIDAGLLPQNDTDIAYSPVTHLSRRGALRSAQGSGTGPGHRCPMSRARPARPRRPWRQTTR